MVDNIIGKMLELALSIQKMINQDLEDIQKANHDGLSSRNDIKLEEMNLLVELKQQLNEQLAKELQNGIDLNIYREQVDNLENEIYNMHELNTKLANIILPLQMMYKELVDELTEQNGSLISIKA